MRLQDISRKFRAALFVSFMSYIMPCDAENARSSSSHPGYEVDGRTSASILSAKRSHAVSDQDKIGLGLYSGIIVIGVIVFFARQRRDK